MSAEYICPVLTAFHKDGSVDMEAMKALFDHLIDRKSTRLNSSH